MGNTVYDYKLKTIKGDELDLTAYKGKKILLVNTASACGYTPQYKQLQELYENFGSKLEVIGLPCNDFGGQEPGSASEIENFCEVNFGVTFPLTWKVKIKGDAIDPLYRFLTSKELNGYADSEVAWNFQKYLINEEGNLTGVFAPGVDPLSDDLLNAIEK
ncbi:MAG TPA: glutathione peroxidase [Chitinophagales bacterium]|nr:glutathione peroxidase [Chitinophagales bacterium]